MVIPTVTLFRAFPGMLRKCDVEKYTQLVSQWRELAVAARQLSREMDADFRFTDAAMDYLRADVLAECASQLEAAIQEQK